MASNTPTATTTSSVYINVIDDVVNKVKDEFLTSGVEETVLNELQKLWESKMLSCGAITGPIERTAVPKPTSGGPVNPVHDLNVPYEPTEEYETPTADMLFPPTPLQTPMQTPLPGTAETSMYQLPTPNTLPATPNDFANMHDPGVLADVKPGRPQQFMEPPQTWMHQQRQRPLGVDVNVAYEEGREEVDRGATQQPPMQDFFMSAGKRKREEYASQLNGGGYMPQQDGPGDIMPQINQVRGFSNQSNMTNVNREMLPSQGMRGPGQIPQQDGPTDAYEDLYPYQGVANEDYNAVNTPATNELQARTPAAGTQGENGDDDEPPLNENDDDDFDEVEDQEEDPNMQHLVLAQFDKVTRTKSRWKCTLKDGIMHINNRDILFSKVFIFPALGGLLFGYDIGATSGATLSLQSPELSGTTWFNLSSVQLGLVVSGSLYGALLGSILAYPIADFLGRRRELIVAALLYIIGGLTTGAAPDLGVLIIGRLVYGLGIGLAMHGAPLYIAETSPSQVRGTLISLKELMIVLGILLGYLVGSYQIDAVGGWRFMYGVSAPIALLMGLGMWSLPPSPRWLLLRAVQGKASLQEYKEKAMQSLSKLRGRPAGDKVSEKQIEETLVSLKSSYADENSEASFWEVFQGPNLKAFVIGGGLVLFQQITGQPSVLYYAGSILQNAGFSVASDAARVSVVIGVFKLLMTGVAVLKVDDLGRRPLLIGGISGIAVSLVLLASYYKYLQGLPIVAVAALLLYVGCYQISFGPISWLMVSEIFPIKTRGRGISLAVLTNFASNAIVTFSFSPLKELLGTENLFLLFAGIAIISLVFVISIVPETKGLSLEEIESKLSK